MTYAQYQAARAWVRGINEVWTQPFDVAVMTVDLRRPTQGGLVSVRMPRGAGAQTNLAQLQDRAANIRQQMDELRRGVKDRGS